MPGFTCAHGHTWSSPLAAEECDCMDPDAAALHLV